jgi:hypothetical protein
MLVSIFPFRPWRAHLECIWQMEDEDGVNFTALAALDTRARRRRRGARLAEGERVGALAEPPGVA